MLRGRGTYHSVGRVLTMHETIQTPVRILLKARWVIRVKPFCSFKIFLHNLTFFILYSENDRKKTQMFDLTDTPLNLELRHKLHYEASEAVPG